MKCKICGHVFDESIKSEACKGCMGSKCNMVKCPNCGYENLPENLPEFKINSKFIRFLKKKINHR